MSEENSVLSVDKYWLDMQMSLCLENLMSLVHDGTAWAVMGWKLQTYVEQTLTEFQ